MFKVNKGYFENGFFQIWYYVQSILRKKMNIYKIKRLILIGLLGFLNDFVFLN